MASEVADIEQVEAVPVVEAQHDRAAALTMESRESGLPSSYAAARTRRNSPTCTKMYTTEYRLSEQPLTNSLRS